MFLFLHGFLGLKEDWDGIRKDLPFSTCAIDLPGHGQMALPNDVVLAVKEKTQKAKWVIGYSAGGRMALELKRRFPNDYENLILFSTHPGLPAQHQRDERLAIDEQWALFLEQNPIEKFLEKWYAQKLFASFKKHSEFLTFINKRTQHSPNLLARFLREFSLGLQTNTQIPKDTYFVYGEEDLKYAKLYRTLNCPNKMFCIQGAGHAVHIEKPSLCSKLIMSIVNEHDTNR